MSVHDLIEELKKHSPLLPVRIRVPSGDACDFCGAGGESYAELDDVRFEGNHISLEGIDG